MGIVRSIKKYEEDLILKIFGGYAGLSWCELGNQGYLGEPAKNTYEKCGVKHTSIDLNGKDGALPLDLCKCVVGLENKFDVITNYGTTEHVNEQYNVFKNIHNMCKNERIMIHGVPAIGNWPDHCRYRYSVSFFSKLAEKCGYNIIDLRIYNNDIYDFPKNLILCVYMKCETSFFPNAETFTSISGIEDSCDFRYTQNYDPL